MKALADWKKEGRLPAKGRALDLGCGGGTNSIWLAENGFDVVGLDFTPRALDFAKARSDGKVLRIKWILADVLKVRFDERFDLIVDRGCYHSLPQPARERYAENVKSWLAPKGVLVLGCFVWRGLSERFHPMPVPRVPEGEPARLFVPPLVLEDRMALDSGLTGVAFPFVSHLFRAPRSRRR